MKTRMVRSGEIPRIQSFYQSCGYDSPLEATDVILLFEEDQEIKAAVRLCREEGVVVLRGMQVREDCQRQGIGSSLLEYTRSVLGGDLCFCIPYAYLEDFYGQIGFSRIDPSDAPAFLNERYRLYRSRIGLDVILMRRIGSTEGAHSGG